MSACASCKRPILPGQKKPVALKNEAGQIIGMLHHKCAHFANKAKRPGKNDRGRHGAVPSPYDMAQGRGRVNREDLRVQAEEEYRALHARQAELAGERMLEHVDPLWSDWRNPEELTLEELVSETRRRERELEEIERKP